MSKLINMTGWKMWEHGVSDSRIIVIGYDRSSSKGEAMWLCECSCGKSTPWVAKGSNIRNGSILSCGCLRKERVSCANRKYNKYDLSNEYGIGWTTNTNEEFYFDIGDYDLIKEYAWYKYTNPKTKYCSLRTRDRSTRKNILMTDLLGCKFYDHIDRNPLNCRRNNLRNVTQQQNATNRSRMSNNTSGFTGVCWDKRRQMWTANICKNYKRIRLGWFEDKEEAVKARLKAEKKYFGELAPQKNLFEEYGIL